MNEDFLPADYRVPEASSGYFKFQPGANRFRFLTKPVMGTELWKDVDGKPQPVRIHNGEAFSKEDLALARANQKPKHFWAAVVYDYQEKKVCELVLNQISILRAIAELCNNAKWGSPLNYDLVVTKKGEGKDNTEYFVSPDPKEALSEDVQAAFDRYEVNLEAFFDGEPVLTLKGAEPEVDLSDVPFGN